ncbi:hypothetical protein FYK55_05745 [Roseiconus nitratireducens]|uniref:Transmembrane protein n=1 Tax=Roseiconus nitratireducens TaxID=2605748 RepID=A0A5M6DCA2_9BACT|nr:hypothetical protein [Roseiconus nitratireducens]KAA5545177.1 hypothetical protein FYK55_05745 [Roseiconus nitratireducens]
MDDFDFNRTPNPFSVFADERERSRRSLLSAVRFLMVVIVLSAAAGLGHHCWQRFQVQRLSRDFASQDVNEKLDGLRQLGAYDAVGIETVVLAVADESPQVSELAFQLTNQSLKSWTTLPAETVTKRRTALVAAIERACLQLGTQTSDERSRRLQRLGQTLVEDLLAEIDSGAASGLEGADEKEMATLDRARAIVAGDWSRTGTGPSPAASRDDVAEAGLKRLPSVALSPAKRPLPLDSMGEAGASWSQWPPEAGATGAPRLYRANVTTLRPLAADDVILSQAAAPAADHSRPKERFDAPSPTIGTALPSTGKPAKIVKPGFHATVPEATSPRTTESRSGDPNAVTATKGVDAAGDATSPADRLNSPSRFDRMRAVAELAGQGDPESERLLRQRLKSESDQTVALRIRKVLEQGAR